MKSTQRHRGFFGPQLIISVTAAAFLTCLVVSAPGAPPAGQGGYGFGPGGATTVDYDKSFLTAHFAGSRNCTACHDNLVDQDNTDISLVKEWSVSLMAYSFVDPLWRSKVMSETLRLPSLSGAIEAKCARCHAPMAVVEDVSNGIDPVIFGDDGYVDPDTELHSAAMEGVGCTLCHQIQDDPDLGTDLGNSGQFTILDPYPDPTRRPIYGQYSNVVTSQMVASLQYLPMAGTHIHESRTCAACHDLKTDYFDADGVKKSEPDTRFPEQMPYREWLESDYSISGTPGFRSCHDCHLAHAAPAKISRVPKRLPVRSNFSRHTFYTENVTMLNILQDNGPDLGIGSVDFSAAIEEGEAYLQEAGAVTVETAAFSGSTLTFDVKVENLAGHKLPTSIPIRRVFLHVTVSNSSSGQVVFESGRPNPDGSIQGVLADVNPLDYEHHYDVITSSDQVQVYEGIMGNTDGDVTYTLLRASHYKKDNRLMPYGFVLGELDDDIKPWGECESDSNFTGGSDRVTYQVPNLPGTSYVIRVELLDQTYSYRFLQDLFQLSDNEVIGNFKEMYSPYSNRFELISDTERVVTR